MLLLSLLFRFPCPLLSLCAALQCRCCYCCCSSPSAAPNRMPPLSLLSAPLTDTSMLPLISAEPLTACQETLPESPSETCQTKGCVRAGKAAVHGGAKDARPSVRPAPPPLLLFGSCFLVFLDCFKLFFVCFFSFLFFSLSFDLSSFSFRFFFLSKFRIFSRYFFF